MIEVRLSIRLKVRGPVLTAETAPAAYGVDAIARRNEAGHLVLAGSLIKGLFREALEQLYDPEKITGTPLEYLLSRRGDPPEFSESTVKRPELYKKYYPVEFDVDFVSDQAYPETESQLLTRIKVDEATRCVALGQLLTIDSPIPAGKEETFCGQIIFFAESIEAADKTIDVIQRTFNWILAVGAFRTVGFGRLGGVEVKHRVAAETDDHYLDWQVIARQVTPGACGPECWLPLEIQPEGPFCVSADVINGNIFESETILSGRVIKGTIARLLQKINGLSEDADLTQVNENTIFPHLCRHFSDLRVLTAHPCRLNHIGRPVVYPCSLVTSLCNAGGRRVYDVALLDEPALLLGWAPRFKPDWKTEDKKALSGSLEQCGVLAASAPRQELRVRTAIDSETRRAEDQKLFAYQCICPCDAHTDPLCRPEVIPLCWRGAIGLHRLGRQEKEQVAAELRQLACYGCLSLGKTKTRGHMHFVYTQGNYDQVRPIPLRSDGSSWIITLMSPTLLVDPQVAGSNPDALEDQYREVFGELSGGCLELTRCFTRQTLIGGFLGYSFRRFDVGSERAFAPYNPLWVSNPGSVFVFRDCSTIDTKAVDVINRWQQSGLPPASWAKAAYGEDYRRNPFLPTDGFGEIAVNLPCHQALKPDRKEVQNVTGI